MKKDLKNYSFEEIKGIVRGAGEKDFRVKQVFGWLYGKRVFGIEEMKNLPPGLREKLSAGFMASSLSVVKKRKSLDGTIKLLLKAADGEYVECVVIPDRDRLTLCVSSQAGCGCGCRFCATAKLGFKRNLSPGEIIEQMIRAEKESGGKITNVVFMGMGEPFNNYDNVIKAVEIISAKNGMNFSQSRITLSTIGVVPAIKKLVESGTKVSLAISVAAGSHEKRLSLVPYEKKYPLKDIVKAVKYYNGKTGKRVTLEYVMLDGINDSSGDAKELVKSFKGAMYKVNLIPYNGAGDDEFRAPEKERVRLFREVLGKNGIKTFIRKERGADIEAACGQLAAGIGQKPKTP